MCGSGEANFNWAPVVTARVRNRRVCDDGVGCAVRALAAPHLRRVRTPDAATTHWKLCVATPSARYNNTVILALMSSYGGDLIREARRRAGLTQADLASRAGTAQPAI